MSFLPRVVRGEIIRPRAEPHDRRFGLEESFNILVTLFW